MSEAAAQPEAAPKGQCRFATKEDRGHFVRLWREYLTVGRDDVSHILPSEHNLFLFWDYCDAYITGRLDGVTILWEPEGGEPAAVAMGGEDYNEPMWEIDRNGERWGVLWGVYVQPAYRGFRLGLQMELMGSKVLLNKGFHRLTTVIRSNNPLGAANQRHWDESRGVQSFEYIILAQLAAR